MPDDQTTPWRTAGIWVIAITVAACALYFGREFFVPIVFAVMLSILLRPVVRTLERFHIPTPLGAAVVVLTLIGLFVLAGWLLVAPIQNWMATAPQRFEQAQEKLNRLRQPVQKVQDVAKKLGQVTDGASTQPAGEATPAPAPAQQSSLTNRLAGATTSILGEIIEVLVLTYLLLASGRLFVQKLVKVTPGFRDKQVALNVIRETQDVVARYIAVTAIINVVQGTIIGLVLWWIGMPSPLVWTAATIVLEFIPYLGATVMVALLSITAFATFDHTGRILAAPGAYLLITTLQNNVVSPYAYGNRLKLNPVAVLVGVLLWWFLWGTGGAFLAVPIVATVKVLADRVERLKPLGEFLGE
ncbi:MAG TPA: AI-2E family transporter [Tepidisphaeraceae bacterium]|jgi:predicted PurR-regulated permease PerM